MDVSDMFAMDASELEDARKNQTMEDSTNIVSKVAYLVGVPEKHFGEGERYKRELYDDCEGNSKAKTIRILSMIRNALFNNFNRIDRKLQYETNINKISEWFESEWFDFLYEYGIELVKPSYRAINYIMDVSNIIKEHIDNCQDMFPIWIEWNYLRNIFMVPYVKEASVKKLVKKFASNESSYPYQTYVNWPVDNPDAYYVRNDTKKEDTPTSGGIQGNILLSDLKFLILLYRINNDKFEEYWRVKDASKSTKDMLMNFIAAHTVIDIIVDCENADPYRLYSVICGLEDYCKRNNNEKGKKDMANIKRILLYDDVHTNDKWNIISKCTNIPVVYNMVDRVKADKSLVDIRMATGACQEHYENNVDAFILVSSDSDFFGLVTSLPNTSFFVCVESNKRSYALTEAYDKLGVPYCYINDFADVSADIKLIALKESLKEYIESHMQLNMNDMIDAIDISTGAKLTKKEKTAFCRRFIKTLTLNIEKNGELSLKIIDK